MYAEPRGVCSLVLHVLIKYPVLVIAMGLLGAGAFATNAIQQPNSDKLIETKVASLAANKEAAARAGKAPNTFDAIIKAESGLDKSMPDESQKYFDALSSLGKGPVGIHPDGKSFGPAGLTEIALTDVIKKLPACKDIAGTNEILNSETANIQFAYLYFLDLIHKYRSLDTAITAYHYGPTRVDTLRQSGKTLPTDYLNKVKSLTEG